MSKFKAIVPRKEVEAFVEEEFERQMLWAKSYFGMTAIDPKWSPICRVERRPKSKFSGQGGLWELPDYKEYKRYKEIVPMILIVLDYLEIMNQPFGEYQMYEDDPEIGRIPMCSWKKNAAALIAHELAHCIQYTIYRAANKKSDQSVNIINFNKAKLAANSSAWLNSPEPADGHTKFFQHIYREFRRKWVNKIPNTLIELEDVTGKVKIYYGEDDSGNIVTGTFELVKQWNEKKNILTINKNGKNVIVHLNYTDFEILT